MPLKGIKLLYGVILEHEKWIIKSLLERPIIQVKLYFLPQSGKHGDY